MQQKQRIEEEIRETRGRLAAFRHVLETQNSRLAVLAKEKDAIDDRIKAFKLALKEAPAAIIRLEKRLEELIHRESMRLAHGGSGRQQPTRVEKLLKKRQNLLRRLAELEANIGEAS